MDPTPVEIVAVREVGPGTLALELETPAGFEATPGQFVQLRRSIDGEPVTRHYSISSPFVEETFEITVEIDPDGTLTPTLAAATPGETVEIDGPFGRVHYEDEDAVVAIGSGPGVGPAVGIAERTIREGGDAAVVVHGDALVHGNRLAQLAAGGATVVFLRDRGRLTAALELVPTAGRRPFVYGFRAFVDVAREALEAAGVDPETARVENFG